jgi:serine protease AprX
MSSYKESSVDQLAEALIVKGITIVAAVGNDENGKIHPPANSLNVIAVGGVDDGNELNGNIKAYHSTYGITVDELMKPELVAHAIWIAAPILPNSKEHKDATFLYKDITKFKDEEIIAHIKQAKYISANYMHVDGTSFATP